MNPASPSKDVDLSDVDITPLHELGIDDGLIEMLNAGQVYTAGQLAAFLRRAGKYERISGLGRERRARLSDRLMDHQIKRAKSKTI